jgi:hypothetical protein
MQSPNASMSASISPSAAMTGGDRIPPPQLTDRQRSAQRLHLAEPPSPLMASNAGTFAVPMGGGGGGRVGPMGGMGGHHRATTMTLVESASVVVVSLSFLENAYMENFIAAETVHLKVVATLLEIFRRHGGEPFGRDNLIGGASWNTFEPDAFHVHSAIECALDLVRTFAQLRLRGVKMATRTPSPTASSGRRCLFRLSSPTCARTSAASRCSRRSRFGRRSASSTSSCLWT